MGPGFVSPEDDQRRGDVLQGGDASMGPSFVSPDDAPPMYASGAAPSLLEWDRALSARVTWLDGFKLRKKTLLQWGRASSARMTEPLDAALRRRVASMGPGFVSPDDAVELGGPEVAEQASMGPGFVSPDEDAPHQALEVFGCQRARTGPAPSVATSALAGELEVNPSSPEGPGRDGARRRWRAGRRRCA